LYYLNTLDDSRVRGASYCFDNYRPDWVHSQLGIASHQISCKYLLGLPGDTVRTEGEFVVVEYTYDDVITGPKTVRTKYKRQSEVRGFPVGYVDVNGVIPEGVYYFGSDFPQGWDSRYIGLVSDDLVLGRAWLLKSFKMGSI